MFAHAQAKNLEEANWIIVGIPSELGSLSKVKSYQNGPDSIREASYRIFDAILGKIDVSKVFDYGDIELEDVKDLNTIYEKIYEELKKFYYKEKKYIFLGGDHSITYPILKLIGDKHEDFYLLFFDAHPDCHPDPYPNYQSFVYYLIEEGVLNPKNVVMVGISNLSFDEKKILEKYNIKYYTPFDVWDDCEKVSKEVSKKLDGKKVYISIDVDVFDTGCGHWLEPFGIRPFHYFKIIRSLNCKLLAVDLVELCPEEFCENLAAKIILETVALFEGKT